MSPKIAMFGHKLPKRDLVSVKEIYTEVEGRPQRDELNLYVTGYEDEPRARRPTARPTSRPRSRGQKRRAKARVHEGRHTGPGA